MLTDAERAALEHLAYGTPQGDSALRAELLRQLDALCARGFARRVSASTTNASHPTGTITLITEAGLAALREGRAWQPGRTRSFSVRTWRARSRPTGSRSSQAARRSSSVTSRSQATDPGSRLDWK